MVNRDSNFAHRLAESIQSPHSIPPVVSHSHTDMHLRFFPLVLFNKRSTVASQFLDSAKQPKNDPSH